MERRFCDLQTVRLVTATCTWVMSLVDWGLCLHLAICCFRFIDTLRGNEEIRIPLRMAAVNVESTAFAKSILNPQKNSTV